LTSPKRFAPVGSNCGTSPKSAAKLRICGGAEALIRMRHPRLGIIQPADFMLDVGDRRSLALSQFVIAQALADWRYFFTEQRPLDISINLPISFIAVAGIL
jgi:EAL domain-containing protein (putative c-di-GMP-specific phosphodiesterase class I)